MPDETRCKRCGKRCRSAIGNPDARLLRRAKKGRCATCSVIDWFQRLEVEHGQNLGGNLPEALRLPHIQAQFGRVMAAGSADLPVEEIDWEDVIRKWDAAPPATDGLF